MRVVFTRVAFVAGLVTVLVGCPVAELPRLDKVIVSPDPVSVEKDKTQTFQADLRDQNGQPFSGPNVTWSVSDSSIASIDPATGVLTAKKFGTVKVMATADGKSDDASVAVKNPPNPPKSARDRTVAKTVAVGSQNVPYYEYTPQDFGVDPNKLYPVLIYLHGKGEKGNGSTTVMFNKFSTEPEVAPFDNTYNKNTDLPMMVLIPNLIDNGNQDQAWDDATIQKMIDLAKSRAGGDPKRIYLAGISLGGGGALYYAGRSKANADQLAALVPMDGSYRGNSFPPGSLACNIASSNLPVVAYHSNSENDAGLTPYVSLTVSQRWVGDINGNGSACTTPAPAARLERTNVTHFDEAELVFSQGYNAVGSGKNMYNYLLQFKRP